MPPNSPRWPPARCRKRTMSCRSPTSQRRLAPGSRARTVLDFRRVMGVVDQHLEVVAVAAQRQPVIHPQVVDVQPAQQAGVHGLPLVVGHERAAVMQAQRPPDVGLGHLVGIQQYRFRIAVAAPRLSHGAFQLGARDDALFQQMIELAGRLLPGGGVVLANGQADGLGDGAREALLFGREASAVALVDEQQHAHQVFAVHQDGHGQHLPGAKAAALVPRTVEGQVRADGRQFVGVVHVADVEGLAVAGAVARHAGGVDGHADFLNALQGVEQEARVEFPVVAVDGVEGELFDLEQVGQVFFQLEEQVVEAGGGANLGRSAPPRGFACRAAAVRRRKRRAGSSHTYQRDTDSATHTGFSWPSRSKVSSMTACAPPSISCNSLSSRCMRMRLPAGTGAGKRTLLTP